MTTGVTGPFRALLDGDHKHVENPFLAAGLR